MQYNAKHILDSINYINTSSFVIPIWVYNSFITNLMYTTQKDLTSELISQSGYILNPLSQEELNLLVIILHVFQKQILQQYHKDKIDNFKLKINIPILKKEIISSKKIKYNNLTLLKFLSFLPGILLRPISHHLHNINDNLDIFKNMHIVDNLNNKPNIDYFTKDITYEIEDSDISVILGISNPYYEIIKIASDSNCNIPLLGTLSPLQIHKALWLDLNFIEQFLFLKLQKILQHDQQWLHFDGIFGEEIQTLITDIDIFISTISNKKLNNRTEKFLYFLENFGKKLILHGILKTNQSTNPLVFLPQDKYNITISWQVSEHSLSNKEDYDYKKECVKILSTKLLTKYLEPLILILGGKNSCDALIKQIKQLIAQPELEEKILYMISHINSNLPITALELFIEWYLRTHFNKTWPLPETIQKSELIYILQNQKSSLEVKFIEFLSCIKDCESQIYNIIQNTKSSFTHILYENNPEILSYLKSFKNDIKHNTSSIFNISVISTPQNTNHMTTVNEDIEDSVDEHIYTKTQDQIYKQLKKLAADELTKIRTYNPSQYSQLKKIYIESLDPKKKTLILELQKQMQEEMFDNHLKYGLLKFMVNNPYCWTSVDNSSADKII